MSEIKEIYGYPKEHHDIITKKIKDILNRGHIVCFRNILTDTKKYVTEWNMDQDGDLTATYSTGQSKFVCPYAIEYEITEVEKLA